MRARTNAEQGRCDLIYTLLKKAKYKTFVTFPHEGLTNRHKRAVGARRLLCHARTERAQVPGRTFRRHDREQRDRRTFAAEKERLQTSSFRVLRWKSRRPISASSTTAAPCPGSQNSTANSGASSSVRSTAALSGATSVKMPRHPTSTALSCPGGRVQRSAVRAGRQVHPPALTQIRALSGQPPRWPTPSR